jgi:iron complex outermembrane receptor protein
LRSLVCVSLLSFSCSALAESPLEEVVVTGTLRPASELDVPVSVSVLDATTLKEAGQQNFEDVLGLIPNLNWAADTSCPRYFQIRGIGELEQYQGAPNPSVGLLLDDVDFSGLGCAVTLFDLDHIEVFRGPQGLRYGANALGGLIYAQSAEPADTLQGRVELGAGNYGERQYGAVVTGPVPELDSGFRLAVQRYTSDGYYRDVYLNRNDTDRRDELTLRGRWRYQPSDRLRLDISVMHVQIDNGYDAYTLDGSRNTQSDSPGVDSQHSTGISLRAAYAGVGPATLTFIGSYADTRTKYSFDGDWGNPILWAPYDYYFNDAQERHRTTHSVEFRLATNAPHGFNWLVGLYGLQLHEGIEEDDLSQFFDPTTESGPVPPVEEDVSLSRFQSRSGAIFGEIGDDLGEKWHWTLGARAERWSAQYADTAGFNFDPSNNLWGGAASLTRKFSAQRSAYATVSRGYKAGGFNLSAFVLPSQIEFSPESDWNFELGYKAELLEHTLRLNTDVFYMKRRSVQIKTSEQIDVTDPNSFTLFTSNVDSGFNYGLESDAQWEATQTVSFAASLGLLQTRYHGLMQEGELLPDRALPNAPGWSAAISAMYHDPRGPFARLDVTGMGSYYFDLPPNWTTSKPYGLVNGRIGWQVERWSASLWGRNLLDKKYAVRGFYFADSPSDPTNRLYTQLGDPRAWGVNFSYSFR